MKERWSCRAFLDQPIPDDLTERLLTMAQHSPSWCNTQPWHLTIFEDAELDRLRNEVIAHVTDATEQPDFPFPERYKGAFQERRRECAWQLYDAVGVTKGDRVASRAQALENFRFFGAPAVAVVTTEAALGLYGAVDCGVYAGNFMIAAQSLGLATIALASLASHSPFFRERLNLPDHRRVVMGIAFGYPDLEHPANNFRTNRVGIDEVSTRLR